MFCLLMGVNNARKLFDFLLTSFIICVCVFIALWVSTSSYVMKVVE